MELKNKLLKLLALLLFFVVIFGGFFTFAMYKENTELKEKDAEYTKKIEELEKEVESYKTKLNTISDILNTALDTDEKEDSEEQPKITELNGTYKYAEEASEMHTYKFEGKNVEFNINHTLKGTYVIEGDKVKITYTEGTGPDGEKLEVSEFPDGDTAELTIVDENTLTVNGVEFKKTEN